MPLPVQEPPTTTTPRPDTTKPETELKPEIQPKPDIENDESLDQLELEILDQSETVTKITEINATVQY